LKKKPKVEREWYRCKEGEVRTVSKPIGIWRMLGLLFCPEDGSNGISG
jgi:hypothetical protein